MRPFLTQFAAERKVSDLQASWLYSEELDQNVFLNGASDSALHFGTQTRTDTDQERTDSDYAEPPPYIFGTMTLTDVDVERTDTDYHDDPKWVH